VILPSTQTLLLLVLVLLLLWLLLRAQEPQGKRARRTPLTPTELARMTFDAARANDAAAWRELFLRGGEAAAVLGAAAEAWLAACSSEALEPEFVRLCLALQPAARFMGGRADAEGRCYLTVTLVDGTEREVLVGRFVKAGSALRFVEPPSGPLAVQAL
jgi:hypothetical protein